MHCLAVEKEVEGRMSRLISWRRTTYEVTPTDLHTNKRYQLDK